MLVSHSWPRNLRYRSLEVLEMGQFDRSPTSLYSSSIVSCTVFEIKRHVSLLTCVCWCLNCTLTVPSYWWATISARYTCFVSPVLLSSFYIFHYVFYERINGTSAEPITLRNFTSELTDESSCINSSVLNWVSETSLNDCNAWAASSTWSSMLNWPMAEVSDPGGRLVLTWRTGLGTRAEPSETVVALCEVYVSPRTRGYDRQIKIND